MGSINGEWVGEGDTQDSNANGEKIFVSVRLRPLNDKEIEKNQASYWDCINNTTILYNSSSQERSLSPTGYTFDRAFGPHCPTRQVYEEAAKKIALSVMGGINSCIFAYGQTSSGKTYTMSGITNYAVSDIYDYMDSHSEREFVLKFSAMEIYNEIVKDLLSSDATPRRLLDDPVRGTVVERLTEVQLRDFSHLKELLSICQAQRRIGETALNEMSSRSHQILSLTVDSESPSRSGTETPSCLTASVSFIDLAGSERSSQTSATGTRLKEGCHINRSLLTLGTVIRKLSKGRNGHIPFRDSKLTRILQHSLSGNARTAIICTLSPAYAHVEQSRSTLTFASCAKEITTNAQVNVLMSDKALVKQLLSEIGRLENEVKNLRSAASNDSKSVLEEKELLVEKLTEDIRDLTQQRDLAESRADDILWSGVASKSVLDWQNNVKGSSADELSASDASEIISPFYSDRYDCLNSSWIEDQDQFLSNDTSPRLYIDKYFGPQSPDPGWEIIAQQTDNNEFEFNLPKVHHVEFDFSKTKIFGSTSSTHDGDKQHSAIPSSPSDNEISDSTVADISCTGVDEENETISDKEEENHVMVSHEEPESEHENLEMEDSDTNDLEDKKEGKIEKSGERCKAKQKGSYMEDLSEAMRNLAEQLEDHLAVENETTTSNNVEDSARDKDEEWDAKFERQKKEIIQLWADCNVPLVYRTYFLMLFKGDPADSVYMEVELRRLKYLKKKLQSKRAVKDDQFYMEAESVKALNREREMLSRQMVKKLHGKEKKALYEKWGIDRKTKQRRLQLCRRVWTDCDNMEHIEDSAAIVAKLVGMKLPATGTAPREMVGFNFLHKRDNIKCFSWRHALPSII